MKQSKTDPSTPFEDIPTTLNNRKRKWYGDDARSTGLAKNTLNDVVQ